MTAYDAIDTTKYVDNNIYSKIVEAIAEKASLRYTLEKAVAKQGAYIGLVSTFNLEASISDIKLIELEERLT